LLLVSLANSRWWRHLHHGRRGGVWACRSEHFSSRWQT